LHLRPRGGLVADNRQDTIQGSHILRLSLGRSSLLAAAAVAGAVVYWRAAERQRARQVAEIDEAVAEGSDTARRLLSDHDSPTPTV
jgi:hypothetical protein